MYGEDAAKKPNIKLSFDSSMAYHGAITNVSTEMNMPKNHFINGVNIALVSR